MEKLDLAGGTQNGDSNCRTLRGPECCTLRWGPWALVKSADILQGKS